MRDWEGSRRAAAVALTLALVTLGSTRQADAHPRGRVVVYGGFYGWAPWYGYGFGLGWGPYWGWGPGPYFYGYPAGPDMNHAAISGMGAVELNVKPNRADVWVDGRYVAQARDLDGYPTYLWLPDGGHHLQVYKDGFKLFDEQIDVRRGMRSELKIKLEPGASQAPGPKPGEKSSIDKPKDEKSKDDKPKEEKPKDEKPKEDQPKGDQEGNEK